MRFGSGGVTAAEAALGFASEMSVDMNRFRVVDDLSFRKLRTTVVRILAANTDAVNLMWWP
jgi:hypothetical protein